MKQAAVPGRTQELVEILFQESLVKILFATETFALGASACIHLYLRHAIERPRCQYAGAHRGFLKSS